ncbi:hypothetical protein C0993_008235 [Termitomyces sp. T159_Od127]|nr:hypothetical protein C0993_008235 [Termitomyces sp. T159_Od127]
MTASSPTLQTRKHTRTHAAKPEKPMSLRPKGKPKSQQKPTTSKSDARERSPGEGEIGNEDQDSAYTGEDRESDKDERKDAYDSDTLDKDDFPVGAKRKRNASGSVLNPSRSAKKTKTAAFQKRKAKSKKNEDRDEDEPDDLNLKDGQEVIGVVVQAPKTGQGASFLLSVMIVSGSFKLHEPVYRQAENEWKAFVEAMTDRITEADPQVPPLPPKDLIHRIYRDVRFSNDKTPYKGHFSASFSRSGRKGIWAKLQPGGESIVAAGSWCPARNELMNIRTNIQRRAGADRLREVISAPEFVAYFGEPQPSHDSSRQSIFGREDELKVAPKGIDKNHRDLDLLKCRSFAVVYRFSDDEVLAEDFAERVGQVVRVMRPFVHCLNDMMTVTVADADDEGSNGSAETD